jgi:hypothetical protein
MGRLGVLPDLQRYYQELAISRRVRRCLLFIPISMLNSFHDKTRCSSPTKAVFPLFNVECDPDVSGATKLVWQKPGRALSSASSHD